MPGRLNSVAPVESFIADDVAQTEKDPSEKCDGSDFQDVIEPQMLPQLPETMKTPGLVMAAQVAGAAALSYATSSDQGGGAGALLAAVHATINHVNSATQVQRQVDQAKALHDVATTQALRIHSDEIVREAEQHMQDVTSQLREAQKEADRDLWEQLNMEKESTMTVASLFLAGAFALTVEGLLPAETRGLWIWPKIEVVDSYYLCLGLCVSMLFVSVLAGMATVRRMSRFMLARTSQQQLTLRKLRQIAHDELRGLRQHIDATSHVGRGNRGRVRPGDVGGNHSSSGSNSSSSEGGQTGGGGGGGSGGVPHMQALLREKRKLFSERLWEQPILVSEWRALGEGRHVSDFSEWFHFDAASTLSSINVWFFKGGALFLLAALGIYTEAHLRSGDEEDEATSERAFLIFWVTLGGVAALCFGGIELSQVLYPTPSWQSTVFRDDNGKSSSSRKPRVRLETVNVSGMRAVGDKFFDATDVNGDGSISLDEICRVLGVTLETGPEGAHTVPTQSAAQGTAHRLLQSSPILQEAVPRLLRLLLQRDPRFRENPRIQQQKLAELKARLDRVCRGEASEPVQDIPTGDVNREKYRALMDGILLEMGF
jgi:uncharacterized membrane protein YgcG